MTKADLITIIADKLRFPWARAELLVDVVFGCMEQSMSRGEKIEIRGFDRFTVRQYLPSCPSIMVAVGSAPAPLAVSGLRQALTEAALPSR